MLSSAAHRRAFSVLAATTLVLALAGCSLFPKPAPDPTRHYVLTGATPASSGPEVRKGALRVGLRSIEMAPYLEGKSMIVRRGENQIDYRDFARWAEPLAVGLNRMLVARLHHSERVGRVFPQPYPFDEARDLDVALTVLRCEGRVLPDGGAVISFACAIEIVRVSDKAGAGGGEVLLREVFTAPETPWAEGDYAALAAGLSERVGQLAERLIAVLPES
jgi:uncharacterized lipoprotein YmbA